MTKTIIRSILILIALAIIPVYWLRLAFDNVPIRDGLFLSTIFIALCGGIFAVRKYGFKNARSLTLLSLTAAVGCLFIGELIFQYHFIQYGHDIPFPSVGDIFNISVYPIFFVGLFNEIRLAKVNWKKLNKAAVILFILVSVILVGMVSYYGIYKSYDASMDLFANLVSMSYGVGDLFIICVTLLLLVLVKEYRGGRFAKIWLFMLTGFICILAADMTWSFHSTEYHDEVWFIKSLLDSFWMAGYLCFAQALFEFGFSIMDALKQAAAIAPAAKPEIVIAEKKE
jgi:hypothetical protein